MSGHLKLGGRCNVGSWGELIHRYNQDTLHYMYEIVKEKTNFFLNVSLPWVFHPTKIYLTQCLMVTWKSWGISGSHLELNSCQETDRNIKHSASKLRTWHPSHLWQWLPWSLRHPQIIVFQSMRYTISTTACTRDLAAQGLCGPYWGTFKCLWLNAPKRETSRWSDMPLRTRHCTISTNHGNLALHLHSADTCI